MVKTKKKTNLYLDFDLDTQSFKSSWIWTTAVVNTCVIYTRVSTAKQMSEGSWLDTQRQACEKFAMDNWLTIVKYFEDKAISWAKLTRPWLDAAIEYLKAENKKEKRIGYFVCTEMSRISRADDVIDSYMKVDEIEDTWVEIKTVNAVRRTETDEDEFMNDFNMIKAKYEKKLINKRCHQWQIEKACRWDWPFNWVPVWYIKQWLGKKSTIIVDDEKAKIVAEWLKLFAENTLVWKADLLKFWNDKWLKTKDSEKKLYLTFIEKQLQITRLFFYAGMLIYPNRGINEPIKWNWDAIISKETLENLIKKIQINEKKWRWHVQGAPKYPEFLLRWFITCPTCWRKLTCRYTRSHTWKLHPYYGCANKNCTCRITVAKELLENAFQNMLSQTAMPEEIVASFNAMVEKKWRGLWKDELQDKNNKSKEKQIEKRIAELELAMSKNVNSAVVDKRNEEWSRLNEALQKIQEEKTRMIYTVENLLPLLDKTTQILINPSETWEQSDNELRQLLIGVWYNDKILFEKKSETRTLGNGLLNCAFIDEGKGNFPSYPEWDLNPHGLAATRFWV